MAAPRKSGVAIRDTLGRAIGIREFGDPEGLPVLFVHGALYGIAELESERDLAASLGLRVIACERPGYGRTPPCSVRNDAVATAATDMTVALDHLGIESAVVLAHDTGFAHACALAAAHGERVTSIIGISPAVPMISRDQIRSMPPQQQILAWSARNAPWLADFLTRLGVERMRKLGPAGWAHAVFAGVEADKAVSSQRTAMEAVARAYAFNAAQNALGFRLDLTSANADWSEIMPRVTCPIQLFHGRANRTIPLFAVERFAAGLDGVTVEVIEGAGHALALSYPHLGLRTGFAMSVRGQRS